MADLHFSYVHTTFHKNFTVNDYIP